ncbi:hypothetical protein RHMOL_Rhmol12G0081000 [Rhododendron molle]|uniref:Uncharacterized protein n=1 Tax=Rhododendron molle TaxID=49168 RepID=A0ACC0LGW5_RHOML|nr:hypothetical protein RHMOL_Rhmol12G0081000 [Rhododendron molle]
MWRFRGQLIKHLKKHPKSQTHYSRLNFYDPNRSMCAECDFKGAREKLAKNMTGKYLF